MRAGMMGRPHCCDFCGAGRNRQDDQSSMLVAEPFRSAGVGQACFKSLDALGQYPQVCLSLCKRLFCITDQKFVRRSKHHLMICDQLTADFAKVRSDDQPQGSQGARSHRAAYAARPS
jgi:hypothetical protein